MLCQLSYVRARETLPKRHRRVTRFPARWTLQRRRPALPSSPRSPRAGQGFRREAPSYSGSDGGGGGASTPSALAILAAFFFSRFSSRRSLSSPSRAILLNVVLLFLDAIRPPLDVSVKSTVAAWR